MAYLRDLANTIRGLCQQIGNLIRAGRAVSLHVSGNWPQDPSHSSDHYQEIKTIFERNGVDMTAQPTEPNLVNHSIQVTTVSECQSLARAELKAARSLLSREISQYPTPIAGCDCQFNHMLDQRRRLSSAINLLEVEGTLTSVKHA